MSQSPKSDTLALAYIFSISLALFFVVYLLRGFGLLTFVPGLVIWVLLLLSIGTGIFYGIQKTRRY